MAEKPYPRGLCPRCRTTYTLTNAGVMRRHKHYSGARCLGSGNPPMPKPAAAPTQPSDSTRQEEA